jgi:multidrug resistance efflux pump
MPHQEKQITPQTELNDRAEIQYLFSDSPTWMLRWGITAIAGLFGLLLLMAYFVQYPDVVEARVVLTTANPPIRIMAKSSSPVAELLVADRAQVTKGQSLAVLENTAAWRDVLTLETWLSRANTTENQENLPENLQLGALQAEFSTLLQHYKDLDWQRKAQANTQKSAALRGQIQQLEALNRNLQRQQVLTGAGFELAEKELARQKKLLQSGIIADKDLEKTQTAWLSEKRQIETSDASILQNRLQIRSLEAQIAELQQNQSTSVLEKERLLTEDIRTLLSSIADWKQTQLVVAPIDGILVYSAVKTTGQSVAAGAEIFAVIPHDASSNTKQPILAKAVIKAADLSKITLGLRTVVSLDGYSANRYGKVEGYVTDISPLPQKEEYAIEITLPDTLVSNMGLIIPFQQEMAGFAKVVCRERRLAERVVDRVSGAVLD